MAGRRNLFFEYDSEGRTVVYTDGSCPGNGRPDAIAGYGVYFGKNNLYNKSGIIEGRGTSNRGEIWAATHALLQAKRAGHRRVAVRTDSTHVVYSMNDWIFKWKKNDWINSEKQEVINKEEFQQLERAALEMDVVYEHVPGHSGNPGNEAAHKLASDAAKAAEKARDAISSQS